MITVTEYLEKVLMAEAAYADFNTEYYDSASVRNVLTDPGLGSFTLEQAISFVDSQTGYSLLNHYPDDAGGFSASVFESNANPGEYTLAIRETAGPADLILEDIFGITLQGVARFQAISLYRYYKKLTTDIGQPVVYTENEMLMLAGLSSGNFSTLTTTPDYLLISVLTENDVGLGVLPADATIDVTGHSLGGHLAMLFTQMFPSSINHVYTFNGAGLGGVGAEILDMAGFLTDIPSGMVTNVVADQGLDVTAGVGYVIGPTDRVFIEQGGPIHNHSISTVADSLAVYKLLATIVPTLDIDSATQILEHSESLPAESLENIINALGGLLNTGVGISEVDNREQLYQAIDAIKNVLLDTDGDLNVQYLGLSFISFTTTSSAYIENEAPSNIAIRYALQNLNTFPIVGSDALYESFSSELAIENFSSLFIKARAYMIERMVEGNIMDAQYVPKKKGQSEYFYDYSSGVQVLTVVDPSSRTGIRKV